jgi:excisionase family DNA binding protein
MATDETEPVLTTREAARHLRVSPRTLEHWRLRGGGPPFRKVGCRAVRYRLSDLDAFLDADVRINTAGGRPA